MTATPRSDTRIAVEITASVLLLLATCAVVLLGVANWMLTILAVLLPCGETTSSCDRAYVGVDAASATMIGLPAAAGLVGAATSVLTWLRLRHAIAPIALALVVAVLAFLRGQAMLAAILPGQTLW